MDRLFRLAEETETLIQEGPRACRRNEAQKPTGGCAYAGPVGQPTPPEQRKAACAGRVATRTAFETVPVDLRAGLPDPPPSFLHRPMTSCGPIKFRFPVV